MKLLIITFSFPPAGGVGVLRALSLAKYLPESGVEVDVLTARNAPSVGQDIELMRQVPETVLVHRTLTMDLPFALRKRIKKAVSDGGSKSRGAVSLAPARALRMLLANLLLPDPQVGWLPFALRAAKRIIRSRQIDAVLITVPPFSSLRLATLLRRVFPDLSIVVDFRDEWLTTTIRFVSFNKNERARAVALKVEAEAVRDATLVIAVTEAARKELSGRYPNQADSKFRCIPNGFETRRVATPPLSQLRTGGDPVAFTYIGSVYGSTDPSTFVEAVLALPKTARDRLRVRFIGHIETSAYRLSLERLGGTIELKGFLPQAEALKALDETDFLLLITHDNINVSAKFYDYLSVSKPIFAAVDPAGEVRRLLDETQAGLWADINDPEAITNMLVRLLTVHDSQPKYNPKREIIAAYDRSVLAKRYAELLRTLA